MSIFKIKPALGGGGDRIPRREERLEQAYHRYDPVQQETVWLISCQTGDSDHFIRPPHLQELHTDLLVHQLLEIRLSFITLLIGKQRKTSPDYAHASLAIKFVYSCKISNQYCKRILSSCSFFHHTSSYLP